MTDIHLPYVDELRDNFLRYVAVSSESDPKAGRVPSSEGQRELAKLLARELEALGLVEIELNEHAILTALLPANVEGAPAVGWVAHLDTVPVSLSPDVKAQVIHYEGGDVLLNAQKDIWVRLEEHPELAAYAGQDIVFTDGTSVLGADNKAAVANVMTMLAVVTRENRPHGDIRVAFVPDEEIGLCGSKLLDLKKFKVDFAYTIDCCALGEIVWETFNACSVSIRIKGVTAHPMSAKGVLVNPLLVATDLINRFDRLQTPEQTEGKEGYWWFTDCEANAAECRLTMNIRGRARTASARRHRGRTRRRLLQHRRQPRRRPLAGGAPLQGCRQPRHHHEHHRHARRHGRLRSLRQGPRHAQLLHGRVQLPQLCRVPPAPEPAQVARDDARTRWAYGRGIRP